MTDKGCRSTAILLFVSALLSAAIVCDIIYESYAEAAPRFALESETPINSEVHQIDACDALAICKNNGMNFNLVEISPVDALLAIEQKLKQENNCKNTNTSCINFGLNNVSLTAISASKGQSQFDTDQIIKQLNVCETGSSCSDNGTNEFIAGVSFSGGSSTLSDVHADTSQKLSETNECTNNAICNTLVNRFGVTSSNEILIGTTNFGGNSHVSNLDTTINQDLNEINQCSNNTIRDFFGFVIGGCTNFGSNLVSFGETAFAGNSSMSDVQARVNQKVNGVTMCSNGGIDCVGSDTNSFSLGGAAFEGNSSISNVNLEIDQEVNRVTECNNAPFTLLCVSTGSNSVSGGSLFGNSNISNLDANIDQKVTNNDICDGSGCRNFGLNDVEMGFSVGFAFEEFIFVGNSTISHINADIDQETLMGNECKNGSSCENTAVFGRGGGFGSNIVFIAHAQESTSSASSMDLEMNQKNLEENKCAGSECFNGGTNLILIAPSGRFLGKSTVSNLDSNINQEIIQDNQCDNSSCFNNCQRIVCSSLNTVNVGLSTRGGTSDVVNVSSNIDQKLSQNNKCSSDTESIFEIDTFCENLVGDNEVHIGASDGRTSGQEKVHVSNVLNDIDQKLSQDNICREGSSCSNNGTNSILIGGTETSPPGEWKTPSSTILDVTVDQNLGQDHHCEVGSICTSTASNLANITDINNFKDSTTSSISGASSISPSTEEAKNDASNRVTLHQLSEQQDQCSFDSTCSDFSSNSATVIAEGYEGDKSIDQLTKQQNHCLIGSSCTNEGSTSVTIDESSESVDGTEVKQSIDQRNLCVKDSTCSNTGSIIGGSGSERQTNTCIDGSTCNNSGENNKTICVGSATCENIGTDTKVVSKGQECTSGDQGTTTVCVNGRTFTH